MNRLAKAVGAALAFALGGAAFARVSLPDISGELEVSGGMLYGAAHEYVIIEEDGSTLSRLDWDEKAVPTVSVAGQVRLFDVFASAGIQFAAPFKGGFMEDWDWLEEPKVASNYSRHTAFLENDFSASFGLGYTFALSEWTQLQIPLRLTPLAGFRYRIRKWTASYGYMEYPPGSPQKKLTGTIITYEQTLSSLSAGLEAEYQASRTVALKLRGSLYPYSWAHTLDTHFGRNLQFYDRMSGGIGGSAQLSALYRPFELPGSPAFTCSLSYEHIGKLTGRTASGDIGAGDYELGWSTGFGSKTESSELSASVGIVWRLGCVPLETERRKLSALRAAKEPVSLFEAPLQAFASACGPSLTEGLILTGAKTHTTAYGDTLSGIAKRYWGEQNGYYYGVIIFASNLFADPDLLLENEVLTIPDLERNLENPDTRRQIKSVLEKVAAIHARKGDARAAESVQTLADSL